MKPRAFIPPILPAFSSGLTAQHFKKPVWNTFAGEAGAFVAESNDGKFEAIAEPIKDGWRFWLVPVADPENALCMEETCASS